MGVMGQNGQKWVDVIYEQLLGVSASYFCKLVALLVLVTLACLQTVTDHFYFNQIFLLCDREKLNDAHSLNCQNATKPMIIYI